MLLRSKKQASPPLKLIIEENTKKKALRKRNSNYVYQSLKKRYSSRGENEILR